MGSTVKTKRAKSAKNAKQRRSPRATKPKSVPRKSTRARQERTPTKAKRAKPKQGKDEIEAGRALLGDTLELLQGQREVLAARQKELRPGSFDPQLAGATATLGRAAAALGTELRRFDTHLRERVANLTPEEEDVVLLDYLEELEPARREKFLQQLLELRGKSVLDA